MDDKKLISVVMPVFNEDKGLRIFYEQLTRVTDTLDYDFELIFVNDGSRDQSLEVLVSFHKKDKRIKIIDLSRNFGHQNALMAGIDHARGKAVILMDVDLEDDPTYLTNFTDYWNRGYDVVYAKRGKRNVPGLRKMCFHLFHMANRIISYVPVDAAGIFCLMDRKVVQQLQKLTERDRYIPGLRSWLGFKQIGIETVRGARYDNRPRVKFGSLFKLAFDSFTSFSTVPLEISMFLGIIFALLSFVGIAIVVVLKLYFNISLQGWASTIGVVLLLGAVQLICMGLQGEYLARVFNEVKNRPNYIINEKLGFDD